MKAGIYVAIIAILSGLLPARNLAALEIAVAGEHADLAAMTAAVIHDGRVHQLAAAENGRAEAADWSIEPVDLRNSWTGAAVRRVDTVAIGPDGDWNPPSGQYRITAVGAAGQTTLTLYLIGLSLRAGDAELMDVPAAERRYAFISADCAMPELTVQLTPALPGEVEFEVRIDYTRNHRDESSTYSGRVNADAPWRITGAMGSDFRGGRATLTLHYYGLSGQVVFFIRGLNPEKHAAGGYIGSISPLWYAPYVAIHESGSGDATVMKQFNETGAFGCGGDDVRYTANASRDGGFGIFQLTDPKPSAQHLWSWKENCAEGVRQLAAAQRYAELWMEKQRQEMLDEGFEVPVPPVTYGGVTFAEGSGRRIEHAVALKRYNGASSGNFCVWDSATKQWRLNPKNNLGFNYVERVCNEVPQE